MEIAQFMGLRALAEGVKTKEHLRHRAAPDSLFGLYNRQMAKADSGGRPEDVRAETAEKSSVGFGGRMDYLKWG